MTFFDILTFSHILHPTSSTKKTYNSYIINTSLVESIYRLILSTLSLTWPSGPKGYLAHQVRRQTVCSAKHIVSEAVELWTSARWHWVAGCQLLLGGQVLIEHSKSEFKFDQEQF